MKRSRDVQWVGANQELKSIEGLAPSETEEKPTSSIIVRRDGKVGAPATWDSFSHRWKKNKREKRGNPLDDGDNLD
jgi:hypothetical protein